MSEPCLHIDIIEKHEETLKNYGKEIVELRLTNRDIIGELNLIKVQNKEIIEIFKNGISKKLDEFRDEIIKNTFRMNEHDKLIADNKITISEISDLIKRIAYFISVPTITGAIIISTWKLVTIKW